MKISFTGHGTEKEPEGNLEMVCKEVGFLFTNNLQKSNGI